MRWLNKWIICKQNILWRIIWGYIFHSKTVKAFNQNIPLFLFSFTVETVRQKVNINVKIQRCCSFSTKPCHPISQNHRICRNFQPHFLLTLRLNKIFMFHVESQQESFNDMAKRGKTDKKIHYVDVYDRWK